MEQMYCILYARPDGSLTSVMTVGPIAEAGESLRLELLEGQRLGYTIVKLDLNISE